MKEFNKKSLVLALPLLVACNAETEKIPSKPNILWIMAEDMGQDLECYGMQAVKTPNLNLLAKNGVQYNAAVCSNPISSPNRSAMMTGLNQVSSKSHNHRSNRDTPIDTLIKPFTYYLRNNGYTTILGSNLVMNKGRKTDCNFKHTPLGEWNGVNNFGLFDKFDEITAEDQPFFAQIQLLVTHRGDWWNEVTAKSKHPVDPEAVQLPPYLEDHPMIRKEFASYLDQVEHMDNELGLIMEDLEKKGILDNTIIFFIGDNGRCDIKGKGYLYESGLKIPMIAWGKGIKPAVEEGLVSVLDITATILDLAGIDRPAYYEGIPLFDLKSGESVAQHDYIYSARDNWDEIVECIRSITSDDYKYIRNYIPEQPWDMHQQYLDFHRPAVHIMRELKKQGKLSPEASLFFADSKAPEELYNIKKDPHELNNLAADPKYSEILNTLRSEMDKWQSENKDYGLEDRNSRVTEDMGIVREYVQKVHPDIWKSITDGNIVDNYKELRQKSNKYCKNKSKK